MTEINYDITIYDLHRADRGMTCSEEAVVAILDAGREIHRELFIGKCAAPGGYTRRYTGKPGLSAALLAGSCRMEFSTGAQARP